LLKIHENLLYGVIEFADSNYAQQKKAGRSSSTFKHSVIVIRAKYIFVNCHGSYNISVY